MRWVEEGEEPGVGVEKGGGGEGQEEAGLRVWSISKELS